jgi:hypothetical protein
MIRCNFIKEKEKSLSQYFIWDGTVIGATCNNCGGKFERAAITKVRWDELRNDANE